MSNVKIAAQVYSVRELAQADFRKTMEGLREIGYEGVELAGLYGLTPTEVRDTLKETGLEAVSAHVGIDLFLEDLEGTVQDYRTIGCSYIGIPALKTDRHFGGEKFQETCAFIRKLSTCCAENGMVLLYHNHSFEFEKTPAGTYLLDEFYQALDADTIQTELDTCWVANGGESPVAYLEKDRGRCPLVHMKDSRRSGDSVELMALGEGELDVAAIARAAVACGAKWLVVEQDHHPFGEPMENMRTSFSYLKSII